MTKSRWCRSSSRRPSTCHILSIAFGHGFAHECVARHPIPTRVRSWSRSWGGALLAISSPAWLRCPVPDEGALLCTPSPARPRPHAHACDQPFATLFAELFPFATQNARSIAQAVRLRRLTYVCDVPLGKRFAARPFGSQLGKCFGNRFARLFASIVCLELIGYCLWLWLNQSGVFAVCLTYPISLPFILPTFFAVQGGGPPLRTF